MSVNEEKAKADLSTETEQPSAVSSPELFGKYGRIDNLARAITHGEYAVNKDLRQMYSQDYRSIFRAIEELVSDGIKEAREVEGCKLIAHDTGDGWYLGVEDSRGDTVAMLEWPCAWPESASAKWLREIGFEVS